jgi:hypothetical protein
MALGTEINGLAVCLVAKAAGQVTHMGIMWFRQQRVESVLFGEVILMTGEAIFRFRHIFFSVTGLTVFAPQGVQMAKGEPA